MFRMADLVSCIPAWFHTLRCPGSSRAPPAGLRRGSRPSWRGTGGPPTSRYQINIIDFQQKREIQITYLPVISIRFVTIFNEVVQLTLSEPELFWYYKDQGGGWMPPLSHNSLWKWDQTIRLYTYSLHINLKTYDLRKSLDVAKLTKL